MNNQIVDSLATLQNHNPEPEGAYVFVKREKDRIIIAQDFLGSYGLYLYQTADWFAISNSFLRLVEYAGSKHKLTLNKEFADYLLFVDLCSSALQETLVSEISLLDRCAVVTIFISDKKLEVHNIDYQENTVDPASAEGLSILDSWQHKWAIRIAAASQHLHCLRADLSGGFDSRLSFALLVSSNVDLDQLFINSNNDNLYTHTEDYRIASEIASYYGFELNNRKNMSYSTQHFPLEDTIDISFYTKLGFCRQMYYKLGWHLDRWYSISGKGGECVRDYYNMSEEEYINKALQYSNVFSTISSKKLETVKQSAKNVLLRSFDLLHKKFRDYGRPLQENRAAQMLYREARCRNHFGRQTVESFFGNTVSLSPLLDPDLHRLSLSSEYCNDANFLTALIFDRYAANLLNFEFQGSRKIDHETLKCAHELNQQHPFVPKPISPIPASLHASKEFPLQDISRVNKQSLEEKIYRAFLSPSFLELLEEYYDRSFICSIVKNVAETKHHPLQMVFSSLGIGCVLWEKHKSSNYHTSYTHELIKYSEWTEEDPRTIAGKFESINVSPVSAIKKYCARLFLFLKKMTKPNIGK